MIQIPLVAPFDGWLCALDEVPDPVFAGRLLGDGLAIDPLGDTLHAPAAGEVVAVHEAGHAVTLRLAPGVDVLMHVGLDTVRLGGQGFAPLVAVGARVAAGDPLLRVDLALVGGRVKSLVTPIIVTESAGLIFEPRAAAGPVRVGDALGVLVGATQAGEASAAFAPTARRVLRVPLAHGLHARPCARLAQVLRGFVAQVRVARGAEQASLASPSAMLRLAVRHGDTVELLASGDQAEEALDALAELIAGGMGESAPLPEEAPEVVAKEPKVLPLEPGDVLSGVTAAPGLAVGQAWRLERPEPEILVQAGGIASEQARFDEALAALRQRLEAEASEGAPAQQAILAAHLGFLEDPELIAATRARIASGLSAGMGWRQTLQAEAEALRASPDLRFAERADDLLDLELRLQWQLAGQEPPAQDAPENAILIAEDLLPSQVAALDASRVVGIATARGGPTSHVAIIAASRGIPALVALGERLLTLQAGASLVLDAAGERLEVSPGAPRLEQARAEKENRAARRAAALASAHQEARMADGERIEVFANLGSLGDATRAVAQGAEGCGLLRTEFLFLGRATAPSESEQAQDYAAIATALEGRPLIVRLLDIGGDKPAPYLPIAAEENPALGLRGIRVALARRDILSAQLRAILRAAPSGDLRIMAPMIARVEELQAVRTALQAEAKTMGAAMPPLGVMVETPAAAVMADALAAQCDFLSIGTNDLTQYTLAMDRGNPAVASGIDGLDPAVLRLIGLTCAGAARHGKWVGVCGALASDPLAVPILIGLGVSELSAAPAMVPEIKALVRGLTLEACKALAAEVCAAASAREVRAVAGALLMRVQKNEGAGQ
ncbi:phosphoenolpyruvate--protein phosphotransferase [Novosphingobium rosa]|uniref:phosphoenolpyruvate--protein phosphotransferase n=1 Tax=Novosphingobium rosa TaxID=76978 RepID=UPI00082F4C96|nr:phosphoenolpyruvate--protein phosphotransferase [Novosphingobium rosa]